MSNLLFLDRTDVASCLDLPSAVDALSRAFLALAHDEVIGPSLFALEGRDGSFHAKGAGLVGSAAGYAAVKVNANFPWNPVRHGLPTIQGLVLLFDLERGTPLAVLESGTLTALRTAAATALAARYLARPESRVAVLVGCGVQGREQLRALTLALPLRRAYLVDLDPRKAEALARALSPELGIELVPSDSLRLALSTADVCVTCTTATEAFVRRADVRPGTFIAAVGADGSHKQELDPELLAAATVIPDIAAQAEAIGELRSAIACGLIASGPRPALADLVSGRHPGRTRDDEITVFDSTGTALQDVAVAALIYESARSRGLGTTLSLFPEIRP